MLRTRTFALALVVTFPAAAQQSARAESGPVASAVVSASPVGSSPGSTKVSGRIIVPAGFPVGWTSVVATPCNEAPGPESRPRRHETRAALDDDGAWTMELEPSRWRISWLPELGLPGASWNLDVPGQATRSPLQIGALRSTRSLLAIEVTDSGGRGIANVRAITFAPRDPVWIRADLGGIQPASCTSPGRVIVEKRPDGPSTMVGMIAPGFSYRELPIVGPRMRVTLEDAVRVRFTPPADLQIPSTLDGSEVVATVETAPFSWPFQDAPHLPRSSVTMRRGIAAPSSAWQDVLSDMTPGCYFVTIRLTWLVVGPKRADLTEPSESLPYGDPITVPDTREEVVVPIRVDPVQVRHALERLRSLGSAGRQTGIDAHRSAR